jgi:predicted nuclease with TOPRIM domain
VRESNAHLRRENEELSKRVAAGAEQLKALKDEIAPQEEMGRKLKADKEALEGINTQLQQDANYWRDRWMMRCSAVSSQ